MCSSIFAGGDAPKSHFSHELTEECCYPVFSNGESNSGLYGYTNTARVTEPSITVSARGTIGFTAIRLTPFTPIVRLISITPIQEIIDIDYLYYALSNYTPENTGTSIPQLTVPMIKKYKFRLPEKDEQKRAVKVLKQIDDILEKEKKQIQKLDELIKSRFVEMFDSLNNYTAFSDLCTIITDGTHQPPKFVEEGIPFLFVSNIVTNSINFEAEKFISENTYNELYKRTPIEIGDIIMSTVGSYGHPAVVTSNKKFLFQRHIAYLKPKQEIINPLFLHSAILSEKVQEQIERRVKGIAQKTLNLSEIKQLRIPLPDLHIQNQFADFVMQVEKQKATVQQSIDKLETLKKSLMQEYFG